MGEFAPLRGVQSPEAELYPKGGFAWCPRSAKSVKTTYQLFGRSVPENW